MSIQPQPSPTDRGDHFDVRLYVRRERGQWTAVAPDFTIAGRGSTPEAAVDDTVQALISYLSSCHDDGLTVAQARRPVPWTWRARYVIGARIARALPLPAWPRITVRDADVELPPCLAAVH